MKILFLAPHPFYQDRGTPIAVDAAVRALSRNGHSVDLLVYHEGSEVAYPNVRIHRIPPPPFVQDVRPGFTLKKIVCDVFMFFSAWSLARRIKPDVVHAVEESVFIARFIQIAHGTPFIYDMDSSMPDQIVEKLPWMDFLRQAMHGITRLAAQHAVVIAPVCDALADVARERYAARQIVALRDVTLLNPTSGAPRFELKSRLKIDGLCFMYVGNLEPYQGLDLLLESFALLHAKRATDALVIVGGATADIEKYRAMAARLGIGQTVHFLGPQPVSDLSRYLCEADVLVSPRTKGSNTPMKIYSYLDSGKPVVATDLFTHTQVLTRDVAELAAPDADAFSAALLRVAEDAELRARLGRNGRDLIAQNYTEAAFQKAIGSVYELVPAAGKT